MTDSDIKTLLLFDVDGTLTVPRKKITHDMKVCLLMMRKKYKLGIVSGSDLIKIKEQVGENVLSEFDYVFAENGLIAYKANKIIGETSISEFLGDAVIKKFVNHCLRYLADLDSPIKIVTFIEFRKGLINISPIGRNCSQKERDEFEQYDKQHKVRETMI